MCGGASGGGCPNDAPTCGDGALDDSESCEAKDLGGATCATIGLGFTGGTLACAADCTFDTAACTSAPFCGDGAADAAESCDGVDLAGDDCTTIALGFAGGTLACAADCTFDTTACTPAPVCGDGAVDAGESCDGVDLAGNDCTTIALGFVGGALACAADCTFDTTACTPASVCGDGTIDAGESCEGTNLAGNDCATIGLGFVGGSLACATNCSFDVSACTASPLCGNVIVDPGEACDGLNLLGATCATIGLGFTGGTLTCTATCLLDPSACTATCGNGAIDTGEDCDGTDLGGAACTTLGLGYAAGTLACGGACTYDVRACTPTLCMNNVVDPYEECDWCDTGFAGCSQVGMPMGNVYCAADCTLDFSGCTTCGSPGRDPGEACDGFDLAGATCSSLGFAGGILSCSLDSCDYNTSYCYACGDGALNGTDACDGADLGVSTCASLGFDGGALACTLGCAHDTSGCFSCGDGARTIGEACEGADLGGAGCTTIGMGFAGGTLGCTPSCAFDTSGCTPPAGCGDGFADSAAGEACDGVDLGGATCAGLGHQGGTLGCTAGCVLDAAGCWPGLASDVNGDAFDDFLAGTSPIFSYFQGGPAGALDDLPDAAIDLVTMAGDLAMAGDLNGDAFADVYAGTTGFSFGGVPPSGSVYFGGAGSSLDATADGVLLPAGGDGTGAAAGDVNGDGYDDLVLGGRQVNSNGCRVAEGAAYVYFGGPGATFESTPDAILTGDGRREEFGRAVAPAGDLNDDGFDDVVVGAGAGGMPGRAYVFFGGPGAFDTTADAMLEGEMANDSFGSSLGSAGDVNSDGFGDLIVGAPGWNDIAGSCPSGRAWIYYGGPGATFEAWPDGILTGSGSVNFGIVAGAGDLNLDGFDDVAVGAPVYSVGCGAGPGRVEVYFGGPNAPFDNAPDALIDGETGGDRFGNSIARAKDVNGDGYADLVVGAPSNDAGGINAGRTYVYFGGPGATFDTTADLVVTGFGGHVASPSPGVPSPPDGALACAPSRRGRRGRRTRRRLPSLRAAPRGRSRLRHRTVPRHALRFRKELVAQEVPGIILLDLVMPQMSGPQFLEELPLIVLSKPVDRVLLERTVRVALGMEDEARRAP